MLDAGDCAGQVACPPDRGAQGLAVEAPAVRPAAAGSRALDRALGLVPGPDPHDGYRLVTDAMQDSLSALTRKRRFPVIG